MNERKPVVSKLDSRPKSFSKQLPLGLKILYSIFMLTLIPVYWLNYGPTNFLYFCDVALILTWIGMWYESSLLVSMCAVGILIPQLFWVLDFICYFFDFKLTGMTAYMFQADHSLFLRGLSLFHGWLPFLLIYLVRKLGYERRALIAWTFLAWSLLTVCYFFTPPPNPHAGLTPVNINYLWGFDDSAKQTWMPEILWLAIVFLGAPLFFYLPSHLVLKRISGDRRG